MQTISRNRRLDEPRGLLRLFAFAFAFAASHVAHVASAQTAQGQRQKPIAEPPRVMSAEKYRELYEPKAATRSGSSRSDANRSPYRAEFFGILAAGEKFVFVIDNSTSMHDGGRLYKAHSELRRSIGRLDWPQKFHVIAFDHATLELPWGPGVSARSPEARRVGPWLSSLEQGEDTRPGPALRLALGLKPDAVFFLTDGQFDDPTPERIRAWNASGVPVHVVDLGPGPPSDALSRIAQESGGTYRKVK